MNQDGQVIKEYRSFEEYKREIYPASSEQEFIKEDDPYTFGVRLAERSLAKLARLLLTEKAKPA